MAEVIREVHGVARWDGVDMVSATLSKFDNAEDVRTTTISVQDFRKLELADTEDNTRKMKQIEDEAAELGSMFCRLGLRIKPLLAYCTNPLDTLFDLPTPRQHGELTWRCISRLFSTCVPKQRRSERRSNASIASTTNLCCPITFLGTSPQMDKQERLSSTTSNSSSPGSGLVCSHDLENDLQSSNLRTPSAPTSAQCEANEETLKSYMRALFSQGQGTSTPPQQVQDEEATHSCYGSPIGPLNVVKIIGYTRDQPDKSVKVIVEQEVKRKDNITEREYNMTITRPETFRWEDFIHLYMSKHPSLSQEK